MAEIRWAFKASGEFSHRTVLPMSVYTKGYGGHQWLYGKVQVTGKEMQDPRWNGYRKTVNRASNYRNEASRVAEAVVG